MCGRYRLSGEIDLIRELSSVTGLAIDCGPGPVREALAGDRILRPYNDIPVIATGSGGGPAVTLMYWQLIHYWCEVFESRYTNFNTRLESLDKKHNRDLLAHRRCLVPATGFFETRKHADGRPVRPREAYEFSLKAGGPMLLGGIYSIWRNPADRQDRRLSCSIITMEPNCIVGEIHPRMPFIVPYSKAAAWLDPQLSDHETLLEMVRPFDAAQLVRTRER